MSIILNGSTGITTPADTVTGNETVGGTLAVTGATTLAGATLGATTATSLSVGGVAAVAVAPGTSGNVLTSNGTTWASTAPASTGITSGTAQAATSGTSIDFTGIPATAKKITIVFNGLSTNGTGGVVFQVGSGSIQTSGYTGTTWGATGLSNNANANWSSYATTNDPNTAATVRNGTVELSYLGSNIWSIIINYGCSNTNYICAGYGTVTLSGTLDRLRITTSTGTDTFDAGSINILYQ